MSQKEKDSEQVNQELPTINEEVTLESINQQMTENFQKVYETLNFLIYGNALTFGHLLMLQGRLNPSEQPTTQLEEDDNEQDVDPVLFPPSPAASLPKSPDPEQKSELPTDSSPSVKCFDCGKMFMRKKVGESITLHAKTTSCKPFQCGFCKMLFKNMGDKNRHEKTHDGLKRKQANDENVEPVKKRLKQNPSPLKEISSKSNERPKENVKKNQPTRFSFTDSSSSDDE